MQLIFTCDKQPYNFLAHYKKNRAVLAAEADALVNK